MARQYSLADVSERLFNRPLGILQSKAEVVLGVVGPRLNIGALVMEGEASQSVPIAALAQRAAVQKVELDQLPGDKELARRDWETGAVLEPYEIWNGVAIIKVRGSLMAENGLNPSSGATGYDGLHYKLRHARGDDRVLGIALDVDSPGGEVVDLMELCSLILEIRDEKRVRSIIRGCAASAGYAIVASGNEVTCADYSISGSIGCIMMHADFSKAMEQDGIDVTMITSAAHKADGNRFEPLAEDVYRRLKSDVDACAATFIDHVAAARSMDRAAVAAQEARFYSGADALKLGLVDKIMPWEASLKEFAQGLHEGASRTVVTAPRAQFREKTMENEGKPPVAEGGVGFTQANIDAAVKAAVTGERERIAALLDLDAESAVSDDLTAAIDAGTTAGDFAIALHKGQSAKASAALANARADAVTSKQLPAGGKSAGTQGQKINRGEAMVASMRGVHPALPK